MALTRVSNGVLTPNVSVTSVNASSNIQVPTLKSNVLQNTSGVAYPTFIQYAAASNNSSVSLGSTVDGIWRDYLSVSITPRYATSKILVQLQPAWHIATGNYPALNFRTYRYINGVANQTQWSETLIGYMGNSQNHNINNSFFEYIDSPATTQTVTYYFQATNSTGSSVSGTYSGVMSNYNSSEVFVWEVAQ